MEAEHAKLSLGSYHRAPVEGYDIDPELSDRNRTVYVKDGKAIIAFRGTNLSDPKAKWVDLGADALVALGMENLGARFNGSNNVTGKAIQKYGTGNVIATGHSLGGSQALYVHKIHKLDTHAFNPGLSPIDVRRGLLPSIVENMIGRKKYGANAHAYVTRKDPISMSVHLNRGLNVHTVKQKHRNAHSIKNFT